MRKFNPIFKYAGVAAMVVYIVFTFIAHLYKPEFGPMTNWLSDYGNYVRDPLGAPFYNLGCKLTAGLLAVFYIGLAQCYWGRKRATKYVICFVGAQVSGLAASVSLIFTSIYTLGTYDALHSTFSRFNMIGMDSFMSFMAIAVFLSPKIPKWLGVMGFATSIFNIIATNAFKEFFLAQWIYIPLFMAFVALVTAYYVRFAGLEAAAGKGKTVEG